MFLENISVTITVILNDKIKIHLICWFTLIFKIFYRELYIYGLLVNQFPMIKRRDFIKNTLISGVGSSLAIPQILQAKNLTDKGSETNNIHYRKGSQSKKIIVAG